jgi:hypothetical protein
MSRTIGRLLAVIPLASALICVGPVAPSAEAHPTCDRRPHIDGSLTGTFEKWRVKSTVYINSGLTIVYWQYQPQGKGSWYDGGSIGCGRDA